MVIPCSSGNATTFGLTDDPGIEGLCNVNYRTETPTFEEHFICACVREFLGTALVASTYRESPAIIALFLQSDVKMEIMSFLQLLR